MNTPNPLIPQGSLESQQYQKRSATKIVVSSILAVHGVVLGGLLFLGCKEEPAPKVADNSGFESLDPVAAERTAFSSSPFGDILGDTNEIVIPPTDPTSLGHTFPSGGTPAGNSLPPGGSTFGGGTRDNLGTGSPSYPPFPTVDTNATTGRTSGLVNDRGMPAQPTTYAVVPNDTFTSIAQKHNVTVAAITTANPGVDSRRLKVGQVLNLPASVTPVTPRVPEGGPASAAGAELTYTVKSGDTLTGIARDHGITVKELQTANGLRGSLIKVGQKLIVPVKNSTSAGR
jgi:LysM repeat protein